MGGVVGGGGVVALPLIVVPPLVLPAAVAVAALGLAVAALLPVALLLPVAVLPVPVLVVPVPLVVVVSVARRTVVVAVLVVTVVPLTHQFPVLISTSQDNSSGGRLSRLNQHTLDPCIVSHRDRSNRAVSARSSGPCRLCSGPPDPSRPLARPALCSRPAPAGRLGSLPFQRGSPAWWPCRGGNTPRVSACGRFW